MSAPPEQPIIFAVTGHRDLRPQDVPTLHSAVGGVFDRFALRYPSSPMLLITALAAGADRLVARVAICRQIPFCVAMPLEEAEYRKDFDAAEGAEFDELLALSVARRSMPFAAGNSAKNVGDPERRTRQYELVGVHLVRNAHVLLALWNGRASDARGGTAQVVEYRLFGIPHALELEAPVLEAAPIQAVYQIVTPRLSDLEPDNLIGRVVIKTRLGEVTELEDPGCALYARIERFNQEARRAKKTPAGA